MVSSELKLICHANFRANPEFELISWERLPETYRELTIDVAKDLDFYGLLLPHNSALTSAKSVSHDIALLFLSLREAGSLPHYVINKLGDSCNKTLVELVLDGVLQIEWRDDFVSGPAAFAALYEQPSVTVKASGKIAQISLDAVKYAQEIETSDSVYLSSRLYFFNRVPISEYWQRQFPDNKSVIRYLGLHNEGANAKLLSSKWQYIPPGEDKAWHAWFRYRQYSPEITYKLYISPLTAFLRETFDITTEVLNGSDAFSFKIGHDLSGLLRPDKFVAYFASFDALQSMVEVLKQRLAHFPAQGVPFTAELMESGILSWGTDPPAQDKISALTDRESWRLWITNQLAIALLTAKRAVTDIPLEPYQFALERLRLAGVDTTSWVPSDSIWQADYPHQ
jgi:hypothetical protein